MKVGLLGNLQSSSANVLHQILTEYWGFDVGIDNVERAPNIHDIETVLTRSLSRIFCDHHVATVAMRSGARDLRR
ncbi:MAG: hypothetical protein RL701_2290 [Pseudomonadota bacterium]